MRYNSVADNTAVCSFV